MKRRLNRTDANRQSLFTHDKRVFIYHEGPTIHGRSTQRGWWCGQMMAGETSAAVGDRGMETTAMTTTPTDERTSGGR